MNEKIKYHSADSSLKSAIEQLRISVLNPTASDRKIPFSVIDKSHFA